VASFISISAPNSLVLISGGNGSVPDGFEQGKAIAATPTMIAVGTRNEIDGPTRITLIRRRADIGKLQLLFSGNVHELTGTLLVETCEGALLLSGEVDRPQATVEVFASDQTEPDEIMIVYS
jgi:hypothetical protein